MEFRPGLFRARQPCESLLVGAAARLRTGARGLGRARVRRGALGSARGGGTAGARTRTRRDRAAARRCPARPQRRDDRVAVAAHAGAGLRDGAAGRSVGAHLGATGMTAERSEEHTSELQSLMRISYAVFCLKKKTNK